MVVRLLVTALVGLAVFVLVGCGDRYAGTWESVLQLDEYLPDGTVKTGPATITIEKHGDGYIVRGFPSAESSYPVKAVDGDLVRTDSAELGIDADHPIVLFELQGDKLVTTDGLHIEFVKQ